MNEIVNKFHLAGDKFMSEVHLRQPGFLNGVYKWTIYKRQRKNTKI